MRILTRENGVIATSVFVAVLTFILLTTYTGLSPLLVYAVVFAIGVLLPLVLTDEFSA